MKNLKIIIISAFLVSALGLTSMSYSTEDDSQEVQPGNDTAHCDWWCKIKRLF